MYFIEWLISSLVIKPYIVKESFAVCAQIGLTWNVEANVKAYTKHASLDFEVKKYI